MADRIDEHLGLGPKHAVPSVEVIPPSRGHSNQQVTQTSQEDDFEFARRNIREMVEQGRDSLAAVQEVADASEAPRAYEVVATMIDKLTFALDKLVDLNKKKQDVVNAKGTPGADKVVNNTQNVVMVGSTDDLLKMINKSHGIEDGEDDID